MSAKILIACEESQTVCKAFRDRGFEAYSCDIQEPSGLHTSWIRIAKIVSLESCVICLTVMIMTLEKS